MELFNFMANPSDSGGLTWSLELLIHESTSCFPTSQAHVRQASQLGHCGLSLVQRPSMMQPWTSTDGLALDGWPGAEDGAEGDGKWGCLLGAIEQGSWAH